MWLSQPVKTLSLPSLVAGDGTFTPGSVLLLLAGTGVVALPAILQARCASPSACMLSLHAKSLYLTSLSLSAFRDPARKLGISIPRKNQLLVPIDLLLSCREDDVLMVPQLVSDPHLHHLLLHSSSLLLLSPLTPCFAPPLIGFRCRS